MKRKITRWTAFGLSLAMLLAAGGCASKPEEGSAVLTKTETPANAEAVKEGTIIWQIPEGGVKDAWESSLNQLLKKKGADYQVEIREYADSWDYSNITGKLTEIRDSGGLADVITIPTTTRGDEDNGSIVAIYPFQEMIQQNLLEPLDSYIDRSTQKTLEDSLPPDALDWAKMDGVTYRISAPYILSYATTMYRKDLLKKYGIEISDLSANPFENQDIFKEVQNKEDVVPYRAWEARGLDLNWWSGVGRSDECALLVGLPDGTLTDLTKTEQFRAYLENIQKFRQEGLISFDTNENNFFAIEADSDTTEVHEETYEYGTYSENSYDMVVIPDTSCPTIGTESRDAGGGIASWSQQKDKAFDFLMRLYTDPDFATLLHNKSTNSLMRFTAGICSNAMLAQDEDGTDNRERIMQVYETYDKNLPAGFRFDITSVKQEADAVQKLIGYGDFGTSCPQEIKDLFTGNFKDIDAALAAAQKLLDEAGMPKIVSEANRQLKEFQAKKK